jgi:outer membrane protein
MRGVSILLAMKRLLFLIAPVLVLAFFLSGTLTAQDQATRIVFIDSQRAINAHPAGQAALELQQQAQEEITGLQNDIRAIIGGAQSAQDLSPEQRANYETLTQSLQASQQRWQQDIEQAVAPALEAVNQAVAEVAQANGYAVVLDGVVAASSGLVVYAQEGLDITDQVLERIR